LSIQRTVILELIESESDETIGNNETVRY